MVVCLVVGAGDAWNIESWVKETSFESFFPIIEGEVEVWSLSLSVPLSDGYLMNHMIVLPLLPRTALNFPCSCDRIME